MSKIVLSKIVTIILIIVVLTPAKISAYSDENGIEDNDIIDVEYEGQYADTREVFDKNRFDFTISPGSIIRGFYEGLLGMKVGQSDEIFVPVGKGYGSGDAPSPELANRELIFIVFIHAVVKDATPDKSSGDLFDTIITWVQIIGGIALVIFVIIGLNGLRSKSTSVVCAHCKSLGRSTKSEGKCSKCGNYYCRASFGRGCPNCKANSFIPI